MSILSGKKPPYLGHKDGQLSSCPNSPNCVSSQVLGKANISPIAFKGDANQAWQALTTVVQAYKGASMTEGNEQYMHFECRTPLLGFVDDVEFYLDGENKAIHVRSASRLGYSDLGKNRQRVEQLRASFNKR